MTDTNQHSSNEKVHVIRLRRRSFSSWMMWFWWFLGLMILLEYTLTSFVEGEPGAAIVAGALFFGILLAGFIVEFVKISESRNQYEDVTPDNKIDEA